MPTDAELADALRSARTIAVVGLSDRPERDSHRVARYLQQHGYRVVPVNPTLTSVLGERSYPSLASVPAEIRVDLVDIFRRSELVGPVVDEAIARPVPIVWMQLGVRNSDAAASARAHGLRVYEDVCTMAEHRRLGLPDAGAAR
jgi:predicted CoA-binding protein